MKISRLTVDKLGVKLYDRASAVIAELVSNSYDADATEVRISAPMGQYLASKAGGQIIDKGFEIIVQDNGLGMDPRGMQEFFLVVGSDRRLDAKRGDTSKLYGRKVMGRKGVGKLAPFGICKTLEVISSGGEKVVRRQAGGNTETGYLTSHILLDYDDIVGDDDGDYQPTVGSLDNSVQPSRGTTIKLSRFSYRRVPEIEHLSRQVAQRFGIRSDKWKVLLRDSTMTDGANGSEVSVGEFDINVMEGTRIEFMGPDGPTVSTVSADGYQARTPIGDLITSFNAGFSHDGRFYPVKGWVAYARESYRDDLMAGVRIYCRHKIAAQTALFNRGAGFHGEHSVRSYFIGELSCDWLDEYEDLIQTDRRDILWSHDLGQAFQEWGQSLVLEVGKRARDPMRKKTREVFREVGRVEERVNAAFPRPEQRDLREKATEIAEMLGKSLREDEVGDFDIVGPLVTLSIDLAPHISLERKLREAAEAENTPAAVIGSILRTAHLAELHSFGRIAYDRVRVIERLKSLKDDPKTVEEELQELIENAPWLINPEWAPITANQALRTLKIEFEEYYRLRTGQSITLRDFAETQKRPDFVAFAVGQQLEVVEIKRPFHKLMNDEMERINRYYTEMRDFLDDPGHAAFKKEFQDFRITLVCDGLSLSGMAKTAFEGITKEGRLEHVKWRDFLLRTEMSHKQFLEEAERQKRDAAQRD
ncbi:hypothetical protein RPC_4308 [Rhodopseudomonas palustris BisB18]|uniref:ATP-binding protein n=2 Tax=Rhodopseudomonas palustris TaxID=1076 RepID=Q20YF5_RHOPB